MKLSELTSVLTQVLDQLAKAKAEILGKLAELEEALEEVEVPQEAQDVIAALKAKAQTFDDIVPDTEPEEPVE